MSKLPNGVRRKPNGTYEKRFYVNGKQYSVSSKTLAELKAKERERTTDILAKEYKNNDKVTFNKLFDELMREKEHSIKGNSIRIYKQLYHDYISPYIGKKRVKAVERREIIDLLSKINGKLANSTYNSILMLIKQLYAYAKENEIAGQNLAENIKRQKQTSKKASETTHRALTQEEQKLFMEEMKNDLVYYNVFAILLCTGMRIGELCALTWSDIDFQNQTISINKTLSHDKEGNIIVGNSAKTNTSNRIIPMTETARTILENQKSLVIPFGGNHVFVNGNGTMLVSQYANRAINRCLKRLEKQEVYIDKFTVHAFRDTFATRFIEQTGNMQVLKTILGHASITMTMDLYAHVLPNEKQKEMEKLNIDIG